jgi:hypothetical protein
VRERMNEFEESLARLGKSESEKTRAILVELENKIYAFRSNEENENNRQQEMKGEEDDFGYYRGYDALLEHVDDKEIQMWQKTFKYLRICGQGFEVPQISIESEQEIEEQAIEGVESKVAESLAPTLVDYDQISSLVIYGSKINISRQDESTQEEEIICAHGIFEEVLEIDNSNVEEIFSENFFLSIDPQDSHKVEVVNSLYDALIPDLTDLISPLVQRMVRVCHEHGVSYLENLDQRSPSSEGSDGDCYFNDDDDEVNDFGEREEEENQIISEW